MLTIALAAVLLLEPLVRDEPAFEATVLRPALSG